MIIIIVIIITTMIVMIIIYSALRAAGNIFTEMVGYKNIYMAENRQPNW